VATDGDKIAAATLAAELLRRGITAHGIDNAVNLYGELLRRVERIGNLLPRQMGQPLASPASTD
jgi:hypothetical protein